jgi:hypothetical protein
MKDLIGGTEERAAMQSAARKITMKKVFARGKEKR